MAIELRTFNLCYDYNDMLYLSAFFRYSLLF